MSRMPVGNNAAPPPTNDWNPYHEEVQFPPPSVQVLLLESIGHDVDSKKFHSLTLN